MEYPKVKDLMGTRYIADYLAAEFTKILETYDAIDLADCKLMEKAGKLLRMHYADTDMINSSDPRLNAILQYNMQAARAEPVESVALPVDDICSEEELMNFYKTFDRSKVYALPKKCRSFVKGKALITAMIMQFPDVKYDISSNAKDIFELVRTDWLKAADMYDCEKYWIVEEGAIYPITCENNFVTLNDGREIERRLFVENFVVLPYAFGTERVITDPVFRRIWDKLIAIIIKPGSKRKTMKDFIELM